MGSGADPFSEPKHHETRTWRPLGGAVHLGRCSDYVTALLETPPESPLASLRRPLARAGDRASPSQQVAQLGFFRCRRGSDVLVERPGFDLWQMTVRQSLDQELTPPTAWRRDRHSAADTDPLAYRDWPETS